MENIDVLIKELEKAQKQLVNNENILEIIIEEQITTLLGRLKRLRKVQQDSK